MAPRSIYTRRFPNPDPPKVDDNPERILRRSNTQADKGISHLQRALSLPTEGVRGLSSFVFDKETDQFSSRSTSETKLSNLYCRIEMIQTANQFGNLMQPNCSTKKCQKQIILSFLWIMLALGSYRQFAGLQCT